VQYNTVQYSTVHYSTLQYTTIQYNIVHIYIQNAYRNRINNFGRKAFWNLNPEWSNYLGRVRDVPRLYKLNPGICFTTEGKKNGKTSGRIEKPQTD
jgi:hypothetical protein